MLRVAVDLTPQLTPLTGVGVATRELVARLARRGDLALTGYAVTWRGRGRPRDVVPPGEGWTRDPYRGEIADGKIFGRATAVSKGDFASFTFAVRALESLDRHAPSIIARAPTSPDRASAQIFSAT